MKFRGVWLAVVLLVVAFAIVWVARGRHAPDVALAASAEASPSPVAASATYGAQQAALQATPQARAWRDRKAFEEHSRRFLHEAPELGAVERSEQARALAAGIDAYEQAGQMSAGEALMLHAAMIRASTDDEAEAAAQIAALTERYRGRSTRREAAWQAQQQSDPRFRDYKSRERAVVAEVMAMREVPGGLSRDEYLRQRLQREREVAYP